MMERGVTEVALRAMLRWARSLRPSASEDRFVVEVSHEGGVWEVVVEPDHEHECIVAATLPCPKRSSPRFVLPDGGSASRHVDDAS